MKSITIQFIDRKHSLVEIFINQEDSLMFVIQLTEHVLRADGYFARLVLHFSSLLCSKNGSHLSL